MEFAFVTSAAGRIQTLTPVPNTGGIIKNTVGSSATQRQPDSKSKIGRVRQILKKIYLLNDMVLLVLFSALSHAIETNLEPVLEFSLKRFFFCCHFLSSYTVKQHDGALEDEVPDASPHESSIVENAGEPSSRFEEEVFADAAAEFSESLPSPRSGFIQLIDSDQSDVESGSAAGTLRRGLESVAVERGIAASSGEGQTEQEPVVLSDSVELSRLQTSLHESFESKRREDFVGFIGHPNDGDAWNSSGLRSNGIACIPEQHLSKNEAFAPIDSAGLGSVHNMNVNVQDNAMETQNHQILEAEAELSQGKTLSPDHAFYATKCALEAKGKNRPLLSLSEAPEVQPDHSSDSHLEVSSDQTCEKIKGCKKSEVRNESYDQEYPSKMNVNKDPACHGCEKKNMLYHLHASAELEASFKDNAVHSESPSSKTCSDTIDESMSQPCPPTSRSATDELHATDPFSQITQGLDRSVPVESEIEKTGHESGKGDGANGSQCHESKDRDSSSPLMSTKESPGNFTSISSEISNPTIKEESEIKSECNANLSHENSVFRDKDVPTPLATLNPGKALEASDDHEDLNLVKQKASLSHTDTEAPVQMDGYTQFVVPYSNGTHSASSSPFKETEDLIPEQDVKNRDSNDKYGSIILHLQPSNDVTIQSESMFIGNNIDMEHVEHSPPAALPQSSDFRIQEKLHRESRSDQNCPNEMPMQADIEVSGTVLDNFNDEKSSSAFISKSCDPSVVHLADENRAHAVKQLVEVNSSDDLKVELLQSEENLVASSEDLKTTVGKSDSLTTTNQTNSMKDLGVFVSEQANSAVEDDILQTSEHASQGERKNKIEESSCNDNSKMSAVCERHENGSHTDIFVPHCLVAMVEPSRDHTRRTIPSNSTAEQVLQNTTTSISDVAESHFLSTLVNDSEGQANDETIDKAMSLEKTRTPLKSLLVESMEENTDSECHKRTMNNPKSPSTATETMSEVKTPELPSYKVYQSQTKGNPTPTYAAKIRLNSPAWILGNRREKQKSRGVYSWISCVCCSSMN
ncbi:hypothetical protein EJ110_NYTH13032 [Nymphaea thermarum]|nr:hypothetical protein EJ110_NYTH13032 [Nymphaea thermarum]